MLSNTTFLLRTLFLSYKLFSPNPILQLHFGKAVEASILRLQLSHLEPFGGSQAFFLSLANYEGHYHEVRETHNWKISKWLVFTSLPQDTLLKH